MIQVSLFDPSTRLIKLKVSSRKGVGVFQSYQWYLNAVEMSLYNNLSLDSAMEDGSSKYMLDGNEFSYLRLLWFFV